MTGIGIEKSIDCSGIVEKVLGIVSKSIFTVSPNTNPRKLMKTALSIRI